jgi:hypothetical protein
MPGLLFDPALVVPIADDHHGEDQTINTRESEPSGR